MLDCKGIGGDVDFEDGDGSISGGGGKDSRMLATCCDGVERRCVDSFNNGGLGKLALLVLPPQSQGTIRSTSDDDFVLLRARREESNNVNFFGVAF